MDKTFSKEVRVIGYLSRDFALDTSRLYKNRSNDFDSYTKLS